VVALLAATLAIVAGCGGGSHPRTTAHAATGAPKCTLSAKQYRVIRRAQRMIVQMHHLEMPLKTVHAHGPQALEQALNRFELAIGVLPPDQRALLIRKAKSATALCQDCFDALEAIEPAVATRMGGGACKPGF
jgi:hypothetical protein